MSAGIALAMPLTIRPWAPVADFHTTYITQVVLETFRERGIQILFPLREARLLDAA